MKEVNKDAPHKTVVWIKAITYELLPTGECGNAVDCKDSIIQVNGPNQKDCIDKTALVLQEIKNVTSSICTG